MKRLLDEENLDLFDVPLFSKRIGEDIVPLRGIELMDRAIKLFAHGTRHQVNMSVSEAADLLEIRVLPDVIDCLKLAIKKASTQEPNQRATPGNPAPLQ
jgi:hypothetical protein